MKTPKDHLYVDFIEGELSENDASDVCMLTEGSDIEKKIISNLVKTRETLKASDEVELPEDEEYYDELCERIMLSVDIVDEMKPTSKPIRKKPAQWLGASLFSLSAILACVSYFSSGIDGYDFNLANQSYAATAPLGDMTTPFKE